MIPNLSILKIFVTFFIFNSVVFADIADNAVDDFCKCAKPAYAKHKEIMEAVKQDLMKNPEAAKAKLQKIEKETAILVKCFETTENKYKSFKENKDFDAKVKKGIEKKCPKPKTI